MAGNWFKSSYSAADNECVEVAHCLPRVGIRDSKASGQKGFTVSAAAFRLLVGGLTRTPASPDEPGERANHVRMNALSS
ncbi:DUF397 domain-containing protein [Streptomyces sp. AC555_RSS877]|uniref:DUF397 domain-containing protein n=1 Tax=Streptomyces sp. AC555_RSS877 TaxID=2823688 RepID=UPI001C2572F1|nr:DUF397 domain-containing protein [Streptomyces sp. AC555_RSS877]